MTTIDLAGKSLDLLRTVPKESIAEKICTFTGYWMPLNFLYLDSVREGETVALNKLPLPRKQKWWAEIKKHVPKSKHHFSIASAIYMWEEITGERI